MTRPGAVRPGFGTMIGSLRKRYIALSCPVCVMRLLYKPNKLLMKLSQFRFDLPLNLIAQNPAKKREDARMMVVHRHTGEIENKHFRDILDYFDDKDVFVVIIPKFFLPVCMAARKKPAPRSKCFCFVN